MSEGNYTKEEFDAMYAAGVLTREMLLETI